MYFSIAAPQVITLPDGTQLSFRVNPADTALVELHIVGVDGNDVPGTHVLTFKRNGGPNDTSFVPTAQIDEQPDYKSADEGTREVNHTPQDAPLSQYASVNDEPIRGPYPDTDGPVDTKPAA